MLAAADVSFNWREMAQFILNEGYDEEAAEQSRRRIARNYYQAERHSSQQSEDSRRIDMPTPRFLQIHTLHSYPAALLNRDDSGLAKRMPFGGAVRTRISSQCLKRHWRTAQDEFCNPQHRGQYRGRPVPQHRRADGDTRLSKARTNGIE